MRAMVLEKQGQLLKLMDMPVPVPGDHQVLVKVAACGICRTDLHVVDGDLKDPVLPLIPGHQITGTVEKTGKKIKSLIKGMKVGIPWLGGSCGACEYCRSGKENLCDKAVYTGYQINGGFAEYCVANADFCFSLPREYAFEQAAPLLCAGLIGYRAYRMAGDGKTIGLYGFGAAAHILAQAARFEGKKILAFTCPGDTQGQVFARSLGAFWAGSSSDQPPEALDAAIIFAPAGEIVPAALRAVRKGGRVVCAGIHMSDIPSFPYSILWGERSLQSVANLTRQDGREFLELAAKVPVKTHVNVYPLEKANEALDDLRQGRFEGAGVISMAKG